MVIDFNNVEEQAVSKFKGGEGETLVRTHSDELCKIMQFCLKPGCSIGMHSHDTNCEVVYIVSGEATYVYDGCKEVAKAGQCHYCPRGHSHTVCNDGKEDLVFFAVVAAQ